MAGAPSPWVERFAGLVPPGTTVLDLACGGGRHTRLFLARGHRVVGVDRDLGGVADLSPDERVVLLQADLEDGSPWPLAGRTFGGVVVTSYLHRPILDRIVEAVAPGGALIYETFAAGNERFGKPTSPEFLLQPGELDDLVAGRLEVVEFGEETRATPSPARIQHIAAINRRQVESSPNVSG